MLKLFSPLTIDTDVPVVRMTCGPMNNSTVKGSMATICVECVDVGSGCDRVWVDIGNIGNVSVMSGVVNGSGVGVVNVGVFDDGEVPVLSIWGQDRAGNNGSRVMLSWRVDLNFPVSTWKNVPNDVWSQPSVEAMFTCPKAGCVVKYSLDGGPLISVIPATNGSAGQVGDEVVYSNDVDVVVREAPVGVLGSNVVRLCVDVSVNGSISAPDWTSTRVEVLMEGLREWTGMDMLFGYDEASNVLTMRDVGAGYHVIGVRGLSGRVIDATPLWLSWSTEALSGYDVTIVTAPEHVMCGEWSGVVVWSVESEDVASFEYTWSVGTSENDITMSDVWTATTDPVVVIPDTGVVGLYFVWVRSVSLSGVRGAVSSVSWRVFACDDAVNGTAGIVNDRAVIVLNETGRWPVMFSVNDGGWSSVNGDSLFVFDGSVGEETTVGLKLGVLQSPVTTVSWYDRSDVRGGVWVSSGPENGTSTAFASFELSDSTRWRVYECSLDGSPFLLCPPRVQFGPLIEGPHVFVARVIDSDGRVIVTSDVYEWTIVTSSGSSVRLSGLSSGSHVLRTRAVDATGDTEPHHEFVWYVSVTPPELRSRLLSAAVTNTMNASVEVTCNVSAAILWPCLLCWRVDGGSESCGLSDVGGRLVVDLRVHGEGRHMVSFIGADGAGNSNGEGVIDVVWDVDVTPPNTAAVVQMQDVKVSAVSGIAYSGTHEVVVSVSSYERLSGVWLAVNDKPSVWRDATSFMEVLPEGTVQLMVYGVDIAGNVDTMGYSTIVGIDTVAPRTRWVVPPAALTNSTVLTGRVGGDDGVGSGVTGCWIDVKSSVGVVISSTFASGSMSGGVVWFSVSNVNSGAMNVTARCVDAMGNVDGTGVWFSVVVDVSAPTSRFDDGLSSGNHVFGLSGVVLGFTASDTQSAVVSWYCVDDSDVWFPVMFGSDKISVVGLSDGMHVVSLRSVDAAGNVELEPWSRVVVTVDTTPPVMAVVTTPAVWHNDTVASVCVSVVDATSTRLSAVLSGVGRVTIDDVRGCVSVIGMSEGEYAVTIGVLDGSGNAGTPVMVSWNVDVSPPVLRGSGDGCEFVDDAMICREGSDVSVGLSCERESTPSYVKWQFVTAKNHTFGECGWKLSDDTTAVSGSWRVESTSSVNLEVGDWMVWDGHYVIRGQCVDASGNVGEYVDVRVCFRWRQPLRQCLKATRTK
jgi:hypothetical protein